MVELTNIHAGVVEEFGLDGGRIVMFVDRFLEYSLEYHLELIGEYLKRADRTSILRDHMFLVPRATCELEKVLTWIGRVVHRG